MIKLRHSFLVGLLLTQFAQAEYRVFLLELTETPETTEAPPAAGAPTATKPPGAPIKTQFPSNLDPRQYVGYFPLKPNQSLDYIDTWMCPGRTDYFKPYCPTPARNPAALPSLATPPAPETPAPPAPANP